MPRTKSPPIHASSPSLALLGLSPQYLLSEQRPVDSFPFLHLPSLPSLNSPPYSCLRTCIKSHGALAHNPLATFLPTHHKIVYKAAHDLALTPVPLSSMTFQPPWPFLLLVTFFRHTKLALTERSHTCSVLCTGFSPLRSSPVRLLLTVGFQAKCSSFKENFPDTDIHI